MDLANQWQPWASCAGAGKYFLELQSDRSWIRRRVETVEALDLERIERRVTLDIDCDHLKDSAIKSGVADIASKRLFVPIATWTKDLQLDIDVRSGSGDVVAVVTSAQDSYASQAMMLALIEEDLGQERFTQEFNMSDLPDEVLADIYVIAQEHVGSRLAEVVNLSNAVALQGDIDLFAGDRERRRGRWWNNLLSSLRFRTLLAQFSDMYMVIIEVPCDASVVTIKYRYVESGTGPGDGWKTRFGLAPLDFAVEARAVSTAQREHIRFIAPGGTTIEDGRMDEFTLDRLELDDALPEIPGHRMHRIATERAVFYTRAVPAGDWWILLQIAPRLGDFYVPALGTVGISLVLLTVCIVAQAMGFPIGTGGLEDAVVSVALVGPSLISVYLTRTGEHELVSRLLFVPRLLVFGTALVAMVVAVFIALDLPLEIVLRSAAGFTLGVWVLLWYTTVRTWRTRQAVRRQSGVTRVVSDWATAHRAHG